MAEDVVLRLKAENAELLRKLEESQAEVQSLRTEVEGLGDSSTGAGDAVDQAVAEMREQFDAARADLDRLEQSTAEASQETEGFAGNIRQATATAEDYQIQIAKAAGALKLLQDTGRVVSDGLDTIAEKTGANTEATALFTEEVRALTSIDAPLDTLKNLFRAIAISGQDMLGVLQKQPEALHRLADALDFVSAEGSAFDVLADAARRAAGPVEKLVEQEEKAADRARLLAESVANLRDQVRPSGEEIVSDLRAVRAVLEEITSTGEPTEQQLIKIGDAAQSLVDRFELIGREVPPDIAELAEQGRRLAEAHKEAEQQAKKHAEALRETDQATVEAKESQEQYTEAVGEGTAEAVDLAKKKLAELEETFQASAQRLDELTQKALAPPEQSPSGQVPLRDELGRFAAQGERAGGRGPEDEAAKRVQQLRREFDALDAQRQEGLLLTEDSLERHADLQNELLEAEGDLARQAQRTGQVFFQSGQRAAEGQQRLNDLIEGAREEVAALADQLGEGSSAGVDAITRQIDAFEGFSQTVGATGTDVQLFTTGLKQELERLKNEAGASFDETAKGAEKGKEGVEKLGDAAKDATKSADELGKSTKTATDHAKELADVEIENLPASIDKATAAAQEHLALLDQILAKWAEISAVIASTPG